MNPQKNLQTPSPDRLSEEMLLNENFFARLAQSFPPWASTIRVWHTSVFGG